MVETAAEEDAGDAEDREEERAVLLLAAVDEAEDERSVLLRWLDEETEFEQVPKPD